MNIFVKTEPFVDVILPNYNKAEFLEDAINSVINQTYKNWHLWEGFKWKVCADSFESSNSRGSETPSIRADTIEWIGLILTTTLVAGWAETVLIDIKISTLQEDSESLKVPTIKGKKLYVIYWYFHWLVLTNDNRSSWCWIAFNR